MKKVLVTGANGQLGQCIQKAARKYQELQFSFKDSSELDVTCKKEINLIFEKSNFDYCINCAAYTNVEMAEKKPELAFAINAEAVKTLAMLCKKKNMILIHISTDYVFDGEKKTPYSIDDAPNPINEYGKSKLKGEEHIQNILANYFIIRTSWLYSEFGHNFYKTVLKKAKAGETLYITDKQTGSPTDANNLAKYVLELIKKNNDSYGTRHFTDGVPMTWHGFAKEILRKNKLNNTTKLIMDNNYRSFVKRPKNSILENKKVHIK